MDQQDHDEFQHLRIRRHAIWQDTCRALKRSNFDFTKPLKITFIAEPAVDDGGPSREFFSEVLRSIFQNGNLFQGQEDCKAIVHNVGALCNEEFKVAGQVIAMSMVHGWRSPSCISKHMFSYMIGGVSSVKPSVDDINNRGIKEKAELVIMINHWSVLQMKL